jgi:hypothetical protein
MPRRPSVAAAYPPWGAPVTTPLGSTPTLTTLSPPKTLARGIRRRSLARVTPPALRPPTSSPSVSARGIFLSTSFEEAALRCKLRALPWGTQRPGEPSRTCRRTRVRRMCRILFQNASRTLLPQPSCGWLAPGAGARRWAQILVCVCFGLRSWCLDLVYRPGWICCFAAVLWANFGEIVYLLISIPEKKCCNSGWWIFLYVFFLACSNGTKKSARKEQTCKVFEVGRSCKIDPTIYCTAFFYHVTLFFRPLEHWLEENVAWAYTNPLCDAIITTSWATNQPALMVFPVVFS